MFAVNKIGDLDSRKLEPALFYYLRKRFEELSGVYQIADLTCVGSVFVFEGFETEDDLHTIGIHSGFRDIPFEFVYRVCIETPDKTLEVFNGCVCLNNDYAVEIVAVCGNMNNDLQQCMCENIASEEHLYFDLEEQHEQ